MWRSLPLSLSLSRLFTSHLFFVWPFLLPGWLNVRVLVGINKPEHYSAVKRHVVRTFSLYLNCLNETDKKAYGVFCVLYFHHSCVPHQETVSYFLSLFLHNFAYYSGQNVTVSLTCFFPQTFLTSFFFFFVGNLWLNFFKFAILIWSPVLYWIFLSSVPRSIIFSTLNQFLMKRIKKKKKRIQSLFFLLIIAQEAEKAAN